MKEHADFWSDLESHGKGNAFRTSKCIWCGERSEMTDSHLIPEFLGGKFAPKISCQCCNSLLGSRYENEAKRNAFVTSAMAKLALSSRKQAYKYAGKVDEKTQMKFKFIKGDRLEAIPDTSRPGQFRGTPKDMKSYWTKQAKKREPNKPTNALEEFFDDNNVHIFNCGDGPPLVKVIYPPKKIEIKLTGQTQNPDARFIFKLVYEFLFLMGYFARPDIYSAMRSFVTVDTSGESDRITINDWVWKFTVNNTAHFRKYRQKEDIPFRGYHYFVLRLSSEWVLYVEVVLFGKIRNLFVVGKLDGPDEELVAAVGEVVAFPVGQREPEFLRYQNVLGKKSIIWADDAVNLRWRQLN